MIEKTTVELTDNHEFRIAGETACSDLNPKALLLAAAAKCSGLTAMMLMERMRVTPKRLEITYSGELNTEQVQAESIFRSFHAVYNVECGADDQQEKASRALTLTHEKYCGMTQMLRKIAPVSHEIAIVSTEPETTAVK